MKILLTILTLLIALTTQAQRIPWAKLDIQPFYSNGLRVKQLYLQPQRALITAIDDTTSAVFYNVDTAAFMFYKGRNYPLSGGTVVNNNGGGSLSQNTKDTTINFNGSKIYADIPSGITYTPVAIDISISSANSTAGDTGEGYSYTFNSSTHLLRIIYPSTAPIGTFGYHIVFTKKD
jgi:hypothetical protein